MIRTSATKEVKTFQFIFSITLWFENCFLCGTILNLDLIKLRNISHSQTAILTIYKKQSYENAWEVQQTREKELLQSNRIIYPKKINPWLGKGSFKIWFLHKLEKNVYRKWLRTSWKQLTIFVKIPSWCLTGFWISPWSRIDLNETFSCILMPDPIETLILLWRRSLSYRN